MIAAPETFFSSDYFEARSRFLAAAKGVGAEIASTQNPNAKGPAGREIFMDCAIMGPKDASAVLVVICGTHGPEGYCGSGVQTGLLLDGQAQLWSKSIKLVFIHAHNPYGFAWDTRFNEDNIDLNRNYLPSFAPPLPENREYIELAPYAAPSLNDEATLAAGDKVLLEFARQHGFPALQSALSGGQYSHPKGIYFGGTAPSWSHLTLINYLISAAESAQKIVTIDMHTGLGPFGHGEIITEAAPDSAHYARQSSIWGDQIKSTKDGSSVSADLLGTMDSALERLFSDKWSASIAIEFGTIDTMSVFRATKASSWLHCYGDPEGPEAPAIVAESRAAFYPETDEWKRMVWARSLDVIGKAAKALGD